MLKASRRRVTLAEMTCTKEKARGRAAVAYGKQRSKQRRDIDPSDTKNATTHNPRPRTMPRTELYK